MTGSIERLGLLASEQAELMEETVTIRVTLAARAKIRNYVAGQEMTHEEVREFLACIYSSVTLGLTYQMRRALCNGEKKIHGPSIHQESDPRPIPENAPRTTFADVNPHKPKQQSF